jgi:hypothetical protein
MRKVIEKLVPQSVRWRLHPLRARVERQLWRLKGRPAQGNHFKQERCLAIGAEYDCRVLVETGTHVGEMVAATRRQFEAVYSIELFRPLYDSTRRRFRRATNVFLYHGDSAVCLPEVLRRVDGRALFWLDGHYSGEGTGKGASECPVLGELDAIATHARNDHCILIDDARHFGVHPDYPPIEEIRRRLLGINPDYEVSVEHDCIAALPPRGRRGAGALARS